MRRTALMSAMPFVFLSRPAHEVPIDATKYRIKRSFVVVPIVLYPALNNWCIHAHQVIETPVASAVHRPASQEFAHALKRLGRTAGTEARKELAPGILRFPGAKLISQEIEIRMLVLSVTVAVFAVHYSGLFRMRQQATLFESLFQFASNESCLCLRFAVINRIIGIPLEGDILMVFCHPRIEHIMQEQVRQQWRYYSALRRTLLPHVLNAILIKDRRFQPTLHVEQHPFALSALAQRTHHQVVIDGIKEPFDVQINNPVILPTPLSRLAYGVQC